MKPPRGLLLVRPIETEDSFSGGCIVIPETSKARLTAQQVEIVKVGQPEICEEDDCDHAHHTTSGGTRFHNFPAKRGMWLLIRPRTLMDTATPERKLWLLRQADVLAIVRED